MWCLPVLVQAERDLPPGAVRGEATWWECTPEVEMGWPRVTDMGCHMGWARVRDLRRSLSLAKRSLSSTSLASIADRSIGTELSNKKVVGTMSPQDMGKQS